MATSQYLLDFIVFFAVTIIFVPAFRRLNLGNVFGYLVAGIIVGPYSMALITGESNIFHLAEIGLILLLFVIGQELSPRRLSTLRSKIIIDGGLQFVITTLVALGPSFWLTGSLKSAFVISMAISLSSTAFVLSYLKESKQLTLSYGQMSFSILLFQDIIIVPILTLLPFLSGAENFNNISLTSFAKSLGIVGLSFVCLRYLLKPLMSFVQKESTEVFTAFCLLVIIGMAYTMEVAGLSKALGSFIAGIFLSESEFKKEIENVIIPFKGMFMGVFFMTLGLQFNLDFFFENLFQVVLLCSGILLLKAIVFYALGSWRMSNSSRSKKLALVMCQGGEFGLVVLALSMQHSIIDKTQLDYLICAFTLSLFVAPLFARYSETIFLLEEGSDEPQSLVEEIDINEDDDNDNDQNIRLVG
ncbi:MAG: monovalent cation:proton antiporter-2 (CPA2) family protein [Bacteriovoracaceae bacterium]|jgi:glutathione-regulated potassium-efflux system protein KefB